MRYEQIGATETYRKANPADLAGDALPFQSAPSTPDIPSAVGKMIVGSYIALVGTFAVTMTGSRLSIFCMAISFFYLLMYLGVPAILLKMEPKHGQRPSLDQFIQTGMQTYTGYITGKDALLQILLVPVLLTFTALVMGIAAIIIL
jgi:hypothetical protein